MTPGVGRRTSTPGLWKWLALADGDRILERDVGPPSSFESFLLRGRWDPRPFGAVAPGARGDEILQAGGSALGPRVEVVAVLSGLGTPTAEARLHLALAGGPGHALASLLAGEATDRVPASDIPGADDDGSDDQDNCQDSRKCNYRNYVVEHGAEDLGDRCSVRARRIPAVDECQDRGGEYPDNRCNVSHAQQQSAPIDSLQIQQKFPPRLSTAAEGARRPP